MRIADILNHKGNVVVTIAPDATVRDLLAMLAEHNIGATVVSSDGASVDGIVSERDIVRALAARGEGILDEPVSAIMTSDVFTCEPNMHIDDVSNDMTQRRIRHIPVMIGGKLAGIVSIGDVVKLRIADLEVERDSLVTYVKSSTS
jgi:CBS domain-containing protein